MTETPPSAELNTAVEQFRSDVAALRAQVSRVIVGQQSIVDGVLTALFCSGHTLLEGVPGVGKTLLIRTLARALRLSFSRIQFTPDLMPADIVGTTMIAESEGGRSRQFVFQRGPVLAQILLADEINRATPKTQSALLEAMAERSVTVGGVTHPLEQPFFVLATQNPLEQEGTYPLPEAQLDRFFFKLVVGTPSREELASVLNRTTTTHAAEVESVLDAPRLLAHQQLIRQVAIADHVQDYAVRLVLGTHPGQQFASSMVTRFVKFGASPRAAQAIVMAAKCRALMDGRAAASIADIQSIAAPALRHRLILNFEAQAQGVTADGVIENLSATMPQLMES